MEIGNPFTWKISELFPIPCVEKAHQDVENTDGEEGKKDEAQKTSYIWDHFQPNGNKYKCRHCGKDFASGDKTSYSKSMLNHIKNSCKGINRIGEPSSVNETIDEIQQPLDTFLPTHPKKSRTTRVEYFTDENDD
uniref:BED-type domain-containing protein n=1 Tax=Meloidogyne hapla TaxID=6305 RepID=A0A1I8BES6_MELHA